MTTSMEQPSKNEEAPKKESPAPEVLALFRLLIQKPPADHDFVICTICKKHGLTKEKLGC
jgi:hypothetical protein